MKQSWEIYDINKLYNMEKNGKLKSLSMPTRSFKYKKKWKSNIIHSVFNYSFVHSFIFHLDTETDILHCIDGKQRMDAFKKFIDNELTVVLNGKKKSFAKLTDDERKTFLNCKLNINVINQPMTVKDRVEAFKRYNDISDTKCNRALIYELNENILGNTIKSWIGTNDWQTLKKKILRNTKVATQMFSTKYEEMDYVFNIVALYHYGKLLSKKDLHMFDLKEEPERTLKASMELLDKILESANTSGVTKLDIVQPYHYEPLIVWYKTTVVNKQQLFNDHLQEWINLPTKSKRKRLRTLNKYSARQSIMRQMFSVLRSDPNVKKAPVKGPLDKYFFVINRNS